MAETPLTAAQAGAITPLTAAEPLLPASTALSAPHTASTVTLVVTFGMMPNVAEPEQFRPVDVVAVSVIA
jgi:hypothetical protein